MVSRTLVIPLLNRIKVHSDVKSSTALTSHQPGIQYLILSFKPLI